MPNLDRYRRRWSDLKTERSSWIGQWQDISKYLLPRNGRFLVTDRNQGAKRHNNIYDNTGTRALRTLCSGLMAGATSPARPWFRLATPDPDLMAYGPVKQWLSHIGDVMRAIFNKSNTYGALHNGYEELGAFGTSADVIEFDFDTVITHTPLTCGQYAIATNGKGAVDALYREFEMTVAQMASYFGEDALRPQLRQLLADHRAADLWIPITHAIELRDLSERDMSKRDGKNMRYASIWYESNENTNDVLRDSGYRRFPALGCRWHCMGGDIYGNSPGQEALGDLKELQHAQLRKSQAQDYIVKPSLQLPPELKDAGVDILPGGANYVANIGQANGMRPAWEVNPNAVQVMRQDVEDIRQRIDETFYKNLFLMLESIDHTGMTAREVAERHEEKLLMIGPVLERLHGEILSPLIDITFDAMVRGGLVPTPPQELNGMDLSVEFISVLAQAQRAVGITAIDRLLGTVMSAAANPALSYMLDKIKGDDVIDAYSDMLGIDPDLIESNDKVAIIRQERAKQQEQMQALAAAQPAARAAKDLAQANQAGLGDLMQQFSGYGLPTGGQ